MNLKKSNPKVKTAGKVGDYVLQKSKSDSHGVH